MDRCCLDQLRHGAVLVVVYLENRSGLSALIDDRVEHLNLISDAGHEGVRGYGVWHLDPVCLSNPYIERSYLIPGKFFNNFLSTSFVFYG